MRSSVSGSGLSSGIDLVEVQPTCQLQQPYKPALALSLHPHLHEVRAYDAKVCHIPAQINDKQLRRCGALTKERQNFRGIPGQVLLRELLAQLLQ
jgi:hypothetical protein